MNVAGWRSIFSEGSVGSAVARSDRSVARKKMVLFAVRCVTLHPGSISIKIAGALNRGSNRCRCWPLPSPQPFGVRFPAEGISPPWSQAKSARPSRSVPLSASVWRCPFPDHLSTPGIRRRGHLPARFPSALFCQLGSHSPAGSSSAVPPAVSPPLAWHFFRSGAFVHLPARRGQRGLFARTLLASG